MEFLFFLEDMKELHKLSEVFSFVRKILYCSAEIHGILGGMIRFLLCMNNS